MTKPAEQIYAYRVDTNQLHREWARRVRARRAELLISQKRLAELAGCTQATISRVEGGLQGPTDGLKWRLATALSVGIDQLFPYPAVHPHVAAEGAA